VTARFAHNILLLLVLCAAPALAGTTRLSGDSEARIEAQAGARYLITRSRSFELTQFAHQETVRTAVVEAEVNHRHRISQDLANNGDETGTVALSVYPIDHRGQIAAPLATRKLSGDQIEVEGSGGVKVIAYGCCAEADAEFQLSLETLRTRYVRSSQEPLLTYTRLGKRPAVNRGSA
jgi:hypothetical protein